jgi:hypothetical protein
MASVFADFRKTTGAFPFLKKSQRKTNRSFRLIKRFEFGMRLAF